jgi:multiple sugar transport system substrate-binding protein
MTRSTGVGVRWAAVLAVVAFLAAACGGGSSEGSEDQVALRWAFWGSSQRAGQAEQAARLYQEQHPGVAVSVEYADWGPYWDKLATQYAGKSSPDVVMMDNGYLGDYAQRGALADLGEFGDTIVTSGLDQDVLEASKIDGALYSLTTGVNSQGVAVNEKVFEEAGVPIPDDSSWTWDDYAEIAAEVSRKSPEGTYGAKTTNYLDAWVLQHGNPWFTPEGGVGIRPETVASGFAFEKRLMESGASPSASVTTEDDSGPAAQSLVNTNRIGMGVFWSSEIVGIATATGSPIRLLRLPRQSDPALQQNSGSYLKAAQSWAISSQSEHPEEAAAFVNFIENDPAVAQLWKVSLGAPLNLANREAVKSGLDQPSRLALDYLDTVTPQDPPPLPPAGGNAQGTEIGRTQTEALFGRMTPQQAGESFVAALTTAVADAQ